MSNTALKEQTLPPMLQQYVEYKERYPDCLIFFQVGDFYELFFDDAVTVSRVINLTLTSRDKSSPNPVPMCGVPIAVIDSYTERLVNAGYSIAIVSQGELPPSGKGMVPRRLERIVTPGIRILGNPANDSAEAIICAVQLGSSSDIAIAFSDVQTGKISIREGLSLDALSAEISRIAPTELILPRNFEGRALDRRTTWVRSIESSVRSGSVKFRTEVSAGRARRENLSNMDGYSSLGATAKRAVSFLLDYVDETTVDARLNITEVSLKSYAEVVGIDSTTRANLELVRNIKDGSVRGTLYEYLDRTVTVGGSRLLRDWILHPLSNVKAIDGRKEIVRAFMGDVPKADTIRAFLKGIGDIERIAARIELRIATPRELGSVRDLLLIVPSIKTEVSESFSAVGEIFKRMPDCRSLAERLEKALVEVPPLSSRDGGIFREGYDADLDRYRALQSSGKDWISELEVSERARTGISSLKIKYNGVFGYFIEITNSNLSKAPNDYIRKQTTANSERFVTEALKHREEEVLGAEEKAVAIERKLFDELRDSSLEFVCELREIAEKLSTLDVLLTFAQRAASEALVEPILSDEILLQIDAGRHPQLSTLLGGSFIPNDISISDERGSFLIITGPNMGGKSTYLRQAALITIMAQIGSFVPAKSAKIGVVDKIFARLGASDDIAEGESTFMVEMREASHILTNATERSLLLIDEIGRGTATSDGLSIARAILEWIVLKIKARTLFATHFHELTSLADIYPTVRNLSVGSVEREGEVIFTHQIKDGAANRSYGIQVAKLAGLPEEVIARSRLLLEEHHAESVEKKGSQNTRQISIFDLSRPTEVKPKDYERLKNLEARISSIDPNEMTPIEALNLLIALRK